MKERPILFSAEMVRAILDGRKTQTRRVMKPQPPRHEFNRYPSDRLNIKIGGGQYVHCPYGEPGDRLWVREALCMQIGGSKSDIECGNFTYKADDVKGLWTAENGFRVVPSIHMPRFASRVTLEVENVRIERVQEINKEDAKAEGVSNLWRWDQARNEKHPEHFVRGVLNPFVANYSVLWDEINAKRGFGWDANPWVWVIEFRRMS